MWRRLGRTTLGDDAAIDHREADGLRPEVTGGMFGLTAAQMYNWLEYGYVGESLAEGVQAVAPELAPVARFGAPPILAALSGVTANGVAGAAYDSGSRMRRRTADVYDHFFDDEGDEATADTGDAANPRLRWGVSAAGVGTVPYVADMLSYTNYPHAVAESVELASPAAAAVIRGAPLLAYAGTGVLVGGGVLWTGRNTDSIQDLYDDVRSGTGRAAAATRDAVQYGTEKVRYGADWVSEVVPDPDPAVDWVKATWEQSEPYREGSKERLQTLGSEGRDWLIYGFNTGRDIAGGTVGAVGDGLQWAGERIDTRPYSDEDDMEGEDQ